MSGKSISVLWGRSHINHFTTRDNNKLPTFVSLFLDGIAWATDAMLVSWKGMWAYAFPLVPKVLVKIKAELVAHSSSAVVAKKSLVTRPTGVEHGAAPGAHTLGKTANAAQIKHIPSGSAGAPVS